MSPDVAGWSHGDLVAFLVKLSERFNIVEGENAELRAEIAALKSKASTGCVPRSCISSVVNMSRSNGAVKQCVTWSAPPNPDTTTHYSASGRGLWWSWAQMATHPNYHFHRLLTVAFTG